MAVTETAAHVQEVFKYVNELYKQADVCFIFDPESDFDLIRRSTLLNLDMLKQPQNVIDAWPKNRDYDLNKYSKPLDDEKERVGKEYPGKLVIFVGSGDRYCFDDNEQSPTYNTWKFGPCINWCPGAFFVRMVNYQCQSPSKVSTYQHPIFSTGDGWSRVLIGLFALLEAV
jgi:hypothetical protein